MDSDQAIAQAMDEKLTKTIGGLIAG